MTLTSRSARAISKLSGGDAATILGEGDGDGDGVGFRSPLKALFANTSSMTPPPTIASVDPKPFS